MRYKLYGGFIGELSTSFIYFEPGSGSKWESVMIKASKSRLEITKCDTAPNRYSFVLKKRGENKPNFYNNHRLNPDWEPNGSVIVRGKIKTD